MLWFRFVGSLVHGSQGGSWVHGDAARIAGAKRVSWCQSLRRERELVTRMYRRLLRLYPRDIRTLYGDNMVSAFAQQLAACRRRGQIASARFVLGELVRLLPDAAAERIATFGSHHSFHGRRLPDASLVRPPDVGKKEWFFPENQPVNANQGAYEPEPKHST